MEAVLPRRAQAVAVGLLWVSRVLVVLVLARCPAQPRPAKWPVWGGRSASVPPEGREVWGRWAGSLTGAVASRA